MKSELTRKFASRLRAVIGKKPVRDLGLQGGPSRSYIYRMLKGEANPSLEEIEAVLRAYDSDLGSFFEPWRADATRLRPQISAEIRNHIENILNGGADLTGLLSFLRALDEGGHGKRHK